jgi:lactate racemase
MDYYINYEGTKIDFSLPPEWNVICYQDKSSEKGVSNAREEVERALDNPIGSPKIEDLASPGMDVVILFDDLQRPTPADLAIPSILNRLNKAGITDERIIAVCALGTHPELTLEQLEGKIGREASSRLKGRVFSHDPHSPDNVLIGRTTRGTPVEVNKFVAQGDLIIGVGECMPHPCSGFGGGCKIVMPGVSSYRTVADHHYTWIRHRNTKVNVLDGNCFYEEIVDAARLSGLAFKLDFVMNEKKEVVKAFAGDPVAEHREASQLAASNHLVKVPKLADVTITSAYPLEIGIQPTKAMFMATYCTRAGGTIIWVASQKQAGPMLPLLREVAGPESTNDWHKRLLRGDIPDSLKPFGVSFILHVIFFKEWSEKFNVIHVTEGLSPEQVAMMGFTHAGNLGEAISKAHKAMPRADVAIFPSGGNVLPSVGEM